MSELRQSFIKFFTSLRVTVVLLALSIILIFVATLDQVNLGIWAVQEKYFRTFFVLWRVGDVPLPVFPGGYFLGGLLLINLVTAHLYRFKRSWKKIGIELTHDPVSASLRRCARDAHAAGFLEEDPDLSRIYALGILNEVLAERGLPGVL